MAYIIAISGKGGTGKTTVAALLIDTLLRRDSGNLLAVDADPASNLHFALGLPLGRTVGDIREEALSLTRKGDFPPGMSKQDYLEYEVQELLVEGDKVDLLAMGRPEGQGCYCAANNMLRAILDRLSHSYRYVVIDTEAGMEHLSRHTTRDADYLLLVSDPIVRGIASAGVMARMVPQLQIKVSRVGFALNRVPDGDLDSLPSQIKEAIAREGLNLVAVLPADPLVGEYDAIGRPSVQLPADSPLRRAVEALVEQEFGNIRS
ncbi:MAG: ATP-binding protein [Anaerolineae bacterium]